MRDGAEREREGEGGAGKRGGRCVCLTHAVVGVRAVATLEVVLGAGRGGVLVLVEGLRLAIEVRLKWAWGKTLT